MSAETVSSTNTIDIYIPLLNEGTDVLRPTKGLVLESDEFQVLATSDYDPKIEEWEFPPGTKVRCEIEEKNGRKLLVARQRVTKSLPTGPHPCRSSLSIFAPSFAPPAFASVCHCSSPWSAPSNPPPARAAWC